MHSKILLAVFIFTFAGECRASEPLVVHEWGTFTCLQDETGTAIGRINTDDEPVPRFVHQMNAGGLFPPTVAYTTDAKGTPAGDPNVTMRLETPVIYFHPAKGQKTPITLDVDVAFHGGVLSQYFPNAACSIDVVNQPLTAPLLITSQTVGGLGWHGATINSGEGKSPQTEDPVWTAPRAVDSAPISIGGEREQFLFYRGVGHIDAPLRVLRHEDQTIEVRGRSDGLAVKKLWLVDIRTDGKMALRVVPELSAAGSTNAGAEFSDQDFNASNLQSLRTTLRDALITDGLFADEAEALLNTWERSYFQNPGERLFFIVPHGWTDSVLPQRISVPARVSRVMVGRIELISPSQRALLVRMARSTPASRKSLKEATDAMTRLRGDSSKTAAYNALAGGHGDLKELGVPVPKIYADFLALGRFRTALVLNSRQGSQPLDELAQSLVP